MEQIKYYSKNDLSLKPDVPGAKMWAVALEKAMLTYFEIEPNSWFDAHTHESEQITLIMEGELFFWYRWWRNNLRSGRRSYRDPSGIAA